MVKYKYAAHDARYCDIVKRMPSQSIAMDEFYVARASLTVFFLGVIMSTLSQEIIESPKSATVFQGTKAVFVCETNGSVSGWIVNKTLLADLSSDIQRDLIYSKSATDDGSTLLTLSIPALSQYNETLVQCLTIKGSSVQISENATLLIQGSLLCVGFFTSTYENDTSITIVWTAPFSLDVTNVDPDIWYSIIIYNVTNENSISIIQCHECTNITLTNYTFVPHSLIAGDNVFNLSVEPSNGVGPGERSPNLTIIFRMETETARVKKTSSVEVAAISISTILFFGLAGGSIALLLFSYKHYHKIKLSEHKYVEYVEYEEVDLPYTRSPSLIETEPNYAYTINNPCPIYPVKNIAYATTTV